MKKIKLVNKKRFIGGLLFIIMSMSIITWISIDFINFPEKYLPTWQVQMENELK